MAPFVEVCRYKPVPSSLCTCPCRSSTPRNSLILPKLSVKYSNLRLLCSKPSFRSVNRRVITAVARVESEQLGDDGPSKEGEERDKEDSSLDQQKVKSRSQFKKRVVFGLGIGLSVGGVVLAGGWVFTLALAAAVLLSAREYFELVRSKGIARGMTPPPRYLSRVCSVICALMPILTLYRGDISCVCGCDGVVVTERNPRFSQLSSTMFGLFYCGYLPCFWVKLRCGLTAPVLGRSWPVLLGGQGHWTVGLVAILVSFCGIIASDTFAFLGGKAFGKTPLISISPKKTWEGAVAGLVGCITVTVLLSKSLSWPQPIVSTIAFGVLNFLGSVFGDLIESMIKRDAGVKDSGSLIPGHGGILDRVDSYVFTGALAYSFVRLHGV
ncbi:hypothetical protein Bca52824_078051 [Brassica carinata]|uniref:Phosphatidate cytidylyltransferase n=1 Tax=Brassica carinata TaxID=52824 RepID=A0A8X7PWS5_BRACI|nr:hypothetical protein Bca52824_078051 [Brassica carinata]